MPDINDVVSATVDGEGDLVSLVVPNREVAFWLLQEPAYIGALLAPVRGSTLSTEQERILDSIVGSPVDVVELTEGMLSYDPARVRELKDLADTTPGQGLFLYGENEHGFVSCQFWNPAWQAGFGGRTFIYMLQDSSRLEVKGPWTSSSGAINRVGLGPVLDVEVFVGEQHWQRCYWQEDLAEDLVHQLRVRGKLIEP